MPRTGLRQELSPRARLVRQLGVLHRQLRASERNALRRANDIGRLLRTLPLEERAAVLREVGIQRRAGQLYARIADHWDDVKPACSSIRQADVFLRRPRPRVGPFLLPWADSWPELYEKSRIPTILEYEGLDGKRHSAVPS